MSRVDFSTAIAKQSQVRLQPKEEVLLLGWGVPMPLPVRSRRYDDKFWQELMGRTGGKRGEKEIKEELGF